VHPCEGIILPQGSAKEGTDRNDAALEENRGVGGHDGGGQTAVGTALARDLSVPFRDSDEEIARVEYALNTRPRKRHGWRTPLEVFSVALGG
jgi:hypothetical protein